GARLEQLNLSLSTAQMEQQRLQTELERANLELAMARRLGPIEEEQARANVDLTKARLDELNMQIQSMTEARARLGGIDPNERDFAFKLYQTEIKPFEGMGLWIPPFAKYVENLLSPQPKDWNQLVSEYNQEQTA